MLKLMDKKMFTILPYQDLWGSSVGKVDFLAKNNPQPLEMFYDLSHVQGDFVTYVTTPQQSGSVTRHINCSALIQKRIPYLLSLCLLGNFCRQSADFFSK